MKKDKKIPSDLDGRSWNKMVDFTKGYGYMILYLSIFTIILLMIKDIVV
jgi:hypothetical protein